MTDTLDFPPAGLRPSLKSAVALRIASSRDLVARMRAGRALELYYEVGDPHSQLSAALARQWLPRLKVELHIRLVPVPPESCYPEAEKQRAFAWQDAERLAPVHGLPAPVAIPAAQRPAIEATLAAAGTDAQAFLNAEATVLAAVQAGEELPIEASPAALLAENAARRARLNHYLPGMWQFHGEWFWALDRCDFLAERLRAVDALEGDEPLLQADYSRLVLQGADPEAAVEFWFSFRSPYSYLAAVEICRRRARGEWPRLQVRPVLPMVMRGLPVPKAKRLYIVRDVFRCAQAQGVAFGRLHDPVGEGVMRLLTVFPWQAEASVQLHFCAVAGQSIWAEGLDVRRDDVMQSIFDRCGLDGEPARLLLAQGFDVSRAESNRDALFAAGLWGVPSYRLGSFVTWGQDRLWMIDRAASNVRRC